jgi:hypothetical protein
MTEILSKMPLRQHANGSIKAASSSFRHSGIGTRPPIRRMFLGTLIYSAKPPLILDPISLKLVHRL